MTPLSLRYDNNHAFHLSKSHEEILQDKLNLRQPIKKHSAMREEIKSTRQWRNTRMEIGDIAEKLNSKLRGWINYFGLYGKWS
jgi:hypothetical protein